MIQNNDRLKTFALVIMDAVQHGQSERTNAAYYLYYLK